MVWWEGVTDRSVTRVDGEIVGKQHAPTAGIRGVQSTLSRDWDASALPAVQHVKRMLDDEKQILVPACMQNLL